MKKILIVEDNPVNSALLHEILSAHQYETLRCETAEEGILIAKRENPALILMDVQLPGMDGYTATKQLKSEPATKHIPVLIVTSFAMAADKKRAFESGADGYVPKPINTRTFPKTVEEILAKRKPTS